MNRLSDRLGGDLNGAVLSALKNFADNYKYQSPTAKQKEEMDFHAHSFINDMIKDEKERGPYRRQYQKMKRPPSTRFLRKVTGVSS